MALPTPVNEASENAAEKNQKVCPTVAEHRATFPPALLQRWNEEEYIAKNPQTQVLSGLQPDTYEWYVEWHPNFRKRDGFLRVQEALFVKDVFLAGSTDFYRVVVRYSLRCAYCKMVGKKLTVQDDTTPCCDPFIEAKHGRLDFKFPGVVALLTASSNRLIMREDWSWETLGGEKEVSAVYSKNIEHSYNYLQRKWIGFKQWAGEAGTLHFIEDIPTQNRLEG